MSIDWKDLIGPLVKLGAPLLGQALGGPLGAAAGKIIAEAFGAEEATPQAVDAALKGFDPASAALIAQAAEDKFSAALAEIGKRQVEEVGETMRTEAASGDPLQRWWRPLYALELSLVECPAFAATLLHALWSGHAAGINGFANLSTLLIAYFGARFGVLGVYVTGRTREKQVMLAGEPAPSVVERVAKAVRGRR
jgi:hypothetical protein